MTGRKPIHKLQSIQRGNNPVDLSIKNIGEADKQVAVKLTVRWTGASLVAYDALPGWTLLPRKIGQCSPVGKASLRDYHREVNTAWDGSALIRS
jgi:hypothetical protein